MDLEIKMVGVNAGFKKFYCNGLLRLTFWAVSQFYFTIFMLLISGIFSLILQDEYWVQIGNFDLINMHWYFS